MAKKDTKESVKAEEKKPVSKSRSAGKKDVSVKETEKEAAPSSKKTKKTEPEKTGRTAAAKKEAPVKAEKAAKKEAPVKTEKAAKKEAPAKAEKAAKKETPVKTEKAAKKEEPAKAEKAAKKEAPAKAENAAKKEEPAKAEKAAKKEAPAKAEKAAKKVESAKAEKAAEKEESAKAEKPAKKEKKAKEEKPAKKEAPVKAEKAAEKEEPAVTEAPAGPETPEVQKKAEKPEKTRKKTSGSQKTKKQTANQEAVSDNGTEQKEPAVTDSPMFREAEAAALIMEMASSDEEGPEPVLPKADDKNHELLIRKFEALFEYARKKDNMLEYQEVIDCFADMKLEEEQYEAIIQALELSNVEILRTSYEEKEDDDDVSDEELELIEDDEDLESDALDLSLSDSVNIEDHVRMYLKEIGKVPLLTADEEIDLARRMEKGEVASRVLSLSSPVQIEALLKNKADTLQLDDAQAREIRQLGLTKDDKQFLKNKTEDELREMINDGDYAKNKLAEANLRLVVSIAKRYVGRGMLFLDLIQEGNLGLIKAVEKFDFRKGFKFSTYATWWIRQAITRAIADQARTIRIPVHMVETINKLVRISRQLLQKLGREPTPDEIAEEMDISVERVREIIKISQEPVSLETPIGEEEDSHLGDFIQDDNVPVPADAAAFTLLREQLQEVLETLTEREQKVLRLRFGLDDGRARTLEEVGREFNVTRERIRQIEAKALRKLRHPSRSRKLKDYLD